MRSQSVNIQRLMLWFKFIMLSIVLAGIFGVIHDQITYTLSPEYYTHFKFTQFQISPFIVNSGRLAVALVGWMATWWVGLILGFIFGSLGIKSLDYQLLWAIKIKVLRLVFFIVSISSFIGYFLGRFLYSYLESWPITRAGRSTLSILPEPQFKLFIIVGTIHNTSYFGVLIALFVGIAYHRDLVKKLRLAGQF